MNRIGTLLTVLIFICLNGQSQNLVPNGDFETTGVITCGPFGQADFGTSSSGWFNPSQGSPDLFSTIIADNCWNFQPLSASTYAGPDGLPGEQAPASGNVMAGLRTLTSAGLNQREYISIQLTAPLTTGSFYDVSFKVSLADSFEFATGGLGAYFSVGMINSGSDGLLAGVPQVLQTDVISDKAGWVTVSGTFCATGPFQYINIGNFIPDIDIPKQSNPDFSGANGTEGSYYFIDDVSVTESCPTLSMGNQDLCVGDTLFLSALQQLCGGILPVSYIWTTGDTTAVIEVMDEGFYGVQIAAGSCVFGDTIFVDAQHCPPTMEMANVFTPNGDGINDIFKPAEEDRVKSGSFKVYDQWGKLMFMTNDLGTGWNGKFNDVDAPAGVYFWVLEYRGKSLKFEKLSGSVTLMR